MSSWNLGNLITKSVESIQQTTAKRYAKLKPKLAKEVKKASDKLFIWLDEKYTNVRANPFKFYSKKPWPELNKEYLARKRRQHKSTAFWQYRGPTKDQVGKTLKNWFRSNIPSDYMGNPQVKIRNFNPSARGRQNVIISVDVYPKADKFDSAVPNHIYNRLFAQKKVKSSPGAALITSYMSNDEQRPIIAPAMQMIINFSVKRKVNKIIKEVLLNG